MAANGKSPKPEMVYADGAAPKLDLQTALNAALKTGEAQSCPPFEIAPSDALHEAASINVGQSRILFVRLDWRPPKPPSQWIGVARIDPKVVGRTAFQVGRDYKAGVDQRALAALEQHFGRAAGTQLESIIPLGEVTTEAADCARCTNTGNGGTIYHVRWNGLWFSAAKFSRAHVPANPAPQRRYPEFHAV